MAQIQHAGDYFAPGIAEHAIKRAENGCILFEAELAATRFRPEDASWRDLDEPARIRAFINITDKNGNLITTEKWSPLRMLQDAFDWQGAPSLLNKKDLTAWPVRFKVKQGEYQGQQRFEVLFINKASGVRPPTSDEEQQLDSEWQSITGGIASGSGVENLDDIPF